MKRIPVIILSLAFASICMVTSAQSDSATIFMGMGKEMLEAKKYPIAWTYYEKATKLNPNNVDAYMGIVDACTKMNRHAPAIKALEDAHKIAPTNDEIYWKLVKQYFKYGQNQKVIDAAPSIEKSGIEHRKWNYMLGKSYYAVQNYAKAIVCLEKYIKDNDEENADAYYTIGHMYTLMSNYKNGIPYYEKALAQDSLNSYSTRAYEYAMVLAITGNNKKATDWFQRALDKGYTARDDFYMNFAYALADADNADKAIVMMEEILTRRPQDIAVLNGIADICYHAGKFKKAISYWDKLLVIDSTNARPLYQIGLAYIKMGNTVDGQKLCDKAIELDPALQVLKHERKL